MKQIHDDEWRLICQMLPEGWEEAARTTGAFRRSRYMTSPGTVLRMLLLHAVHDGGLRETVSLARASGLADISQVALLKRQRTSGDWLAWIAKALCEKRRAATAIPKHWRIRAVDSTSISGPNSTGTDWRVHYAINLTSLDCDWHEVTDVHGGEALQRTPMAPGDIVLADRNYLSPHGLGAAYAAGAAVLIRLRWRHLSLLDARGRPFHALQHSKRLKVGEVRDWPVTAMDDAGHHIAGRVVVIRLSRVVAEKSQRRLDRVAQRKSHMRDPKSIEAANYIMVFTTLSTETLNATGVLELYRSRWQIELAFKRLKQLMGLGRLPHRDARAARTWILAKLVVSLLIEQFLANARTLSPWGYPLDPSATAA